MSRRRPQPGPSPVAAVVPIRRSAPAPNPSCASSPPPSATNAPEPDPAPWFVDRPSAAHAIGIGTTTLDALIKSGQLAACKVGRRVLIHRDDLADYAARLRAGMGRA